MAEAPEAVPAAPQDGVAAIRPSTLNTGRGVLYMISFAQKVLNPATNRHRNENKPASSFYLSEHATFEQFKATLFDHLANSYDPSTIYTADILRGTFKITRHVKNPYELLETGAGYALAMETVQGEGAEKVDITLTQQKVGQKHRRGVNDVAGQDRWMRGRPRPRIGNGENGVPNNQGGVGAAGNAVGPGEDRGFAGDMNVGGVHCAEDEMDEVEDIMPRGGDALMDEIVDEEEARRRRRKRGWDEIQREWACNSRACPSSHCWICPRNNSHLALTPQRLNVWVEAIWAEENGVDKRNPPPHRFFDPAAALDQVQVRQNMIQNRNNQENQPPAPPPPQPIVINNHLPLFPAAQGRAPAQEAPFDAIDSLINVQPLSLDKLCLRYGLSDDIRNKAAGLKITGAHGFYIVLGDKEAMSAANFEVGEIADIRFALHKWRRGL